MAKPLKKRFINEVLEDLGKELSLRYESFCDDWLIKLTQKTTGETHHVLGYHFDLNSETGAKIAQDKYATYILLQEAFVPVLPQTYLMRGNSHWRNDTFNLPYQYPFVCKPNHGSGGRHVYKVSHDQEFRSAIETIHQEERGVVISPFKNILTEYRIIMLQGEPILIYGKKSGQSSWKHNLSEGAELIDTISKEEKKRLTDLAKKTTEILNLTLCTVDIIHTDQDELLVIEVNSSICLEHFSKISEETYNQSKEVYKKILEAVFTPRP